MATARRLLAPSTVFSSLARHTAPLISRRAGFDIRTYPRSLPHAGSGIAFFPRSTLPLMADPISRVSVRRLSLLGHFYHPVHAHHLVIHEPPSVAQFHPIGPDSPRLDLNFVPDISNFLIYDSYQGLLLLREKRSFPDRRFLICDPLTREYTILPPFSGGRIIGAGLLSRPPKKSSSDIGFEAVCLELIGDNPRVWTLSSGDFPCNWRALLLSKHISIKSNWWIEMVCVHAAGSLFWHICHTGLVLTLDPAKMLLLFTKPPTMMWDGLNQMHKFRVGEMSDGTLCIGSFEKPGMLVCIQSNQSCSSNGWAYQSLTPANPHTSLSALKFLPRHTPLFHDITWLSNFDAGVTGKVFLHTSGHESFSFQIHSRHAESLDAPNGMFRGYIFPFCSLSPTISQLQSQKQQPVSTTCSLILTVLSGGSMDSKQKEQPETGLLELDTTVGAGSGFNGVLFLTVPGSIMMSSCVKLILACHTTSLGALHDSRSDLPAVA